MPASTTVWTSCHTTDNDDYDDDDANMNAACALYLKSPALTFFFSYISKTIIKRRKRLNNTTNASQTSTCKQKYRFIAHYCRLYSSNKSSSVVYFVSSSDISDSFIHPSIHLDSFPKERIKREKKTYPFSFCCSSYCCYYCYN
jgi:hypothetical protein